MRRAEIQRRMELQQNNRAMLLNHLANSQFAQKLWDLPLIKAAVGTAGGAYDKVKGSSPLVGKSLELAMSLSTRVVDRIAPLAERGINAAAPITTKVDEIAAMSLDGLIARVPVINEEPKEIVNNTKCALEKRVSVINTYTEAALKTWPVQSAMDVYETILTAAYNTLETVLPPTKDEQKNGSQSQSTKESLGEQEKHKRGLVLAQRTYLMVATAFRRVFGICQQQVENAAQATEDVYKSVRSVVADSTNNSNSAASPNNAAGTTEQNNGEVKSNKKKNKNKNQEQ